VSKQGEAFPAATGEARTVLQLDYEPAGTASELPPLDFAFDQDEAALIRTWTRSWRARNGLEPTA
jgi:hypothetical protein